ncbi:MAG: hypothetical protein ACO3MW_12175 [Rhodospirillales bacterium]
MENVLHRSHRIEAGFPFTSLWHGIARFFKVINNAIAVRNEYTRLYAYSDAELNKKGFAREEIAQYIARKYF